MSLTLLVIAGCTNGPDLEQTVATPTTTPGSAITPGEIDPGLAPLIDIALKDLSERIDTPSEQITVVEGRLVEWPDASMGCPEPDMIYIQVPMDGAIILLEAGGEIYQYHTGGEVEVFLCENPAEEFETKPGS